MRFTGEHNLFYATKRQNLAKLSSQINFFPITFYELHIKINLNVLAYVKVTSLYMETSSTALRYISCIQYLYANI